MAKHRKSFKKPKHDSPVKAKKHLGQHFLKDEEIAAKIADTLTYDDYKNVIEIGPGTGMLTKYILQNEVDLVAMDLDQESIVYLNSNFILENPLNKKGKITVLEADFLKHDLLSLFNYEQFAITGNFPYNISTQIVFKMLELKAYVPEFTGMFQKEVAARICSANGSKAYGILSVYAQAFYDAEYLFTVPPDVFDPPPKVDSGVLRLTRKKDFKLSIDEKLFLQVIKTAFNQRRKTLRNSLKSFALSDNLKEDTIFTLRPEQLTVADFVGLTEKIANDTL
ncbi:16S rRNA (adenine(1518)-N(6)/adenine(1519)-N(6))-dimethyltransferase RsmA [Kriegella sp. EG-1]|nr:16S rRNA (adenine(1518)-N(6)/adenine(1519)-N(6))-dimethyltransferase RsmA [Flavobacteriaceae bacterium EG-1]